MLNMRVPVFDFLEEIIFPEIGIVYYYTRVVSDKIARAQTEFKARAEAVNLKQVQTGKSQTFLPL